MIKSVIGLILAFLFGIKTITELVNFNLDHIGSILGFGILTLLLAGFSISGLKESSDKAEKEAEEQARKDKAASERKELLADAVSKELQVKYLGGTGYGLVQGENYYLALLNNSIILLDDDNTEKSVAFADINSFEVGGPGTTTTNAGISGGGFGIEGFIKGAVTAAVINAATTKSNTNTFLKITSNKGEIFLHTAMCEPAELRMILSPLSINITNRIGKAGNVSVADELSKLNDLVKSGVITENDFLNAKNKILGQ